METNKGNAAPDVRELKTRMLIGVFMALLWVGFYYTADGFHSDAVEAPPHIIGMMKFVLAGFRFAYTSLMIIVPLYWCFYVLPSIVCTLRQLITMKKI